MRFSSLLVLGLLPGCFRVEIHDGDGISATDVRQVGSFDAVSDEGRFDVQITAGDAPSVAVTCDENLTPYIWTDIHDGALVIQTDPDGAGAIELLPHTDCSVSVVATALTGIEASGSGAVTVDGDEPLPLTEITASGSGDVTVYAPIAADSLDATSSGSGGIQLDAVDAGQVALTTSGSGDLHVLDGATDLLDLVSTGSGDMPVRKLSATSVRAVLSGSGDAEVTAGQSLKATLTGSGDLTVFGAPTDKDIESTGSGDVLLGD